MGASNHETEVLVIGAGPGGYSAAFRAADLGMEVTLVDMEKRPGGECLFRGCIPSKTLLYMAELLHDAQRSGEMGVKFDKNVQHRVLGGSVIEGEPGPPANPVLVIGRLRVVEKDLFGGVVPVGPTSSPTRFAKPRRPTSGSPPTA